jgi:undecaprenyldiphospho-muramoylpentapeptide beta-N-acetylglucosaminyltransferase
VYPALAVVQALKDRRPLESLWVGSRGGLEKGLVERAGIPFQDISAAGLRGKNPLALLEGVLKLSQGYWQSRRLLSEHQPDVLFITGGYVCVPVAIAAHQAGVPILIYLPDIEPGQAIKFLSRFATKVAVTAPATQAFFPAGLTAVTGYPVREALYQTDPQVARARLNLEPNLPVILAFGGSQGARSLNRVIANPMALSRLLAGAQLVHISGHLDAEWTQAVYRALPPECQTRYHLYPYLHTEMSDAFAAADLIICRAGASILGEIPAVGTPAILVPYPHSGAHQWANAHYLADRGAAIIIADAELETKLVETALELLNNPEKRSRISAASRQLARPEAARAVAAELEELSYVRHSNN